MNYPGWRPVGDGGKPYDYERRHALDDAERIDEMERRIDELERIVVGAKAIWRATAIAGAVLGALAAAAAWIWERTPHR